jgi:hypothetical protein
MSLYIFFSFCFLVVHLIIPGLNETTVKLPTSIMLEISDALKAQLGKQQSSVFGLFSDLVLAPMFLGYPRNFTKELFIDGKEIGC